MWFQLWKFPHQTCKTTGVNQESTFQLSLETGATVPALKIYPIELSELVAWANNPQIQTETTFNLINLTTAWVPLRLDLEALNVIIVVRNCARSIFASCHRGCRWQSRVDCWNGGPQYQVKEKWELLRLCASADSERTSGYWLEWWHQLRTVASESPSSIFLVAAHHLAPKQSQLLARSSTGVVRKFRVSSLPLVLAPQWDSWMPLEEF